MIKKICILICSFLVFGTNVFAYEETDTNLDIDNVVGGLLDSKIETPTGLKLVKEVIDPEKGAVQATFSYNRVKGDNGIASGYMYQIYYGKSSTNLTEKSNVFSDNPTSFIIKGKKGDVLYFAIKAIKAGVGAGESDLSNPIEVVIGGKNENTETIIVDKKTEEEKSILNASKEVQKLPQTGPEHIFLLLLALVIGFFVTRKRVVN